MRRATRSSTHHFHWREDATALLRQRVRPRRLVPGQQQAARASGAVANDGDLILIRAGTTVLVHGPVVGGSPALRHRPLLQEEEAAPPSSCATLRALLLPSRHGRWTCCPAILSQGTWRLLDRRSQARLRTGDSFSIHS